MLKKYKLLVVSSLLLVMFLLLIVSARSESRVFDEVTHVNAGYHFLVDRDFRYDPFNPPFARELIAIPLLFSKNLINDLILFWPRLITVAFTISLGIIVFLFSNKLYGLKAGVFGLLIFILEPNILANGHYAQSDLIFSFFFVLSLYSYLTWRKKFNLKRILIFGLIVGLLLSTKITALLFFPISFLIILIIDNGRRKIFNFGFIKKQLLKIFLFVFTTLFFLWATYFFTFEPMLGLRFDKNRPAIQIAKTNSLVNFALNQPVPLGSYISSIKQQLVFNYSGLYMKNSMILGNLSAQGQSGFYFIPLIFIKIPWIILATFFITLYLFRKKVLKDSIVLVPIIIILVETLFTNTTIVIRYILPVIPLIIIYLSQIVNAQNRLRKLYLPLILLVLTLETFSVFPHFISYTNLSLGGYKNGYKYVFDSNYDWGQGLIDLKKYQTTNNIKNLKLAYFGDVNPSQFNINYEEIFRDIPNFKNYDIKTMKVKKNSIYAISETCWYMCGYYKLPDFKGKKINTIVGGSILIFKP